MILHDNQRSVSFYFPSQYTLQSVRGLSATVLTVTINGMQQTHPVDISPIFKLNHN